MAETGDDRALQTVHTMRFLKTLHVGEIDNIHLIEEKYGLETDPAYSPERELMFADSLANGEVSYMFRKYGFDYYEIPESKKIDQ